MNVVIIGAGGHGQVVADILLAAGRGGEHVRAIGYVDDRSSSQLSWGPNQTLLGTVAQLSQFPHDAVVVAIGDNETRARIMCALTRAGERFVTARHPSAIVSEDVQSADGSVLGAGTVVVTGS